MHLWFNASQVGCSTHLPGENQQPTRSNHYGPCTNDQCDTFWDVQLPKQPPGGSREGAGALPACYHFSLGSWLSHSAHWQSTRDQQRLPVDLHLGRGD